MRFKKGSRVEVMNNEMPATWRAAEIVSGDRDAYNVTYDGYKGAETVSRKFVRPCPPAISLQSWVSGDIVEVFDENSWKVATVLKVLKGGRFLVRLHGFAHEMKVQKMNVRTRQSWRDGQWVPVGKIAGSYGDMKTKIGQEENDSIRVCNDARLQESYVVSKNHKRASPFCSSFIETCPRKVEKVKATGHSFEKVDVFAYPGNTLGNQYIQDSFNNSLNGVGNNLARISEPNDLDSDRCSVGSCSIASNGLNKLSSQYDADTLSSDGESLNTSRDEQEIAVSIHRLELHAYRSTLEALYASGPLSWEKEALLTNLRINLHISNDEHLTELRSLISSGAD
ncbi:agenet domain-containing protein [Tanacetum coccineum]